MAYCSQAGQAGQAPSSLSALMVAATKTTTTTMALTVTVHSHPGTSTEPYETRCTTHTIQRGSVPLCGSSSSSRATETTRISAMEASWAWQEQRACNALLSSQRPPSATPRWSAADLVLIRCAVAAASHWAPRTSRPTSSPLPRPSLPASTTRTSAYATLRARACTTSQRWVSSLSLCLDGGTPGGQTRPTGTCQQGSTRRP